MARTDVSHEFDPLAMPDNTLWQEQALIEEARQIQRQRQHRGWIVMGTLALALVVVPSIFLAVNRGGRPSATATSSSSSNSALPTCSLSDLPITGRTGWGAAAGTSYTSVHLVNRGPACRLTPFDFRAYNTGTHSYVGPPAQIFSALDTNLTKRQLAQQRLNSGSEATLAIGFETAANVQPPSLCKAAGSNAISLYVASHPAIATLIKIGLPPEVLSVCTRSSSEVVFWPVVGNKG